MSNKSINKSSKDILKNVGERLKKQKSKNKDNDQKKDNNNKKEPNNSQKSKSTTSSTKNKQIDDKDTHYKTSFMVKPKYEKIYMDARFKIRRKFKSVLTKQDDLELGLLLLDQIDEDILDEIVEQYSKEDDLIEVLKEYIQSMG